MTGWSKYFVNPFGETSKLLCKGVKLEIPSDKYILISYLTQLKLGIWFIYAFLRNLAEFVYIFESSVCDRSACVFKGPPLIAAAEQTGWP